MEARKVTEEEAKELMTFCKKKDVYYIDLRLELVDHLAHSIEEYWEENPKASFSQALVAVYKRFGIFGFLDVVEEHHRSMSKRYRRIMGKTILEVLAWPRVLGFVMLVLVLFQSMSTYFVMRQVGVWIFAGVVIIGSIFNIRAYLANKKILGSEITVLMKSPIQGIILVAYLFLQVGIRPHFWGGEGLTSDWTPFTLTLIITSSLIYFIANYLIQLKLRDQLSELKMRLA